MTACGADSAPQAAVADGAAEPKPAEASAPPSGRRLPGWLSARETSTGLWLSDDPKGPVVYLAIEGTSAAAVDLEPGDVLVSVGGVPVEGLATQSVWPMLNKPVGEPVEVVRRRAGALATVTLENSVHVPFLHGDRTGWSASAPVPDVSAALLGKGHDKIVSLLADGAKFAGAGRIIAAQAPLHADSGWFALCEGWQRLGSLDLLAYDSVKDDASGVSPVARVATIFGQAVQIQEGLDALAADIFYAEALRQAEHGLAAGIDLGRIDAAFFSEEYGGAFLASGWHSALALGNHFDPEVAARWAPVSKPSPTAPPPPATSLRP